METIKFIPCSEDSQIYSFTRTNKKSKQLDLNVNGRLKPNTFKKLKKKQ